MWDGDLTGEVVDGRYALGTLYGSGGMAEVYRAFDARLDRKVAIKFFQGQASGEDRIRLDREAQVLSAMRCPGLVEVYDTGVHRGRPYFVMQPIEGGTLRRRMRGAMSPEVVATIGAQVAGVLAHVHAQDVVHRDVKPSNILLDTAGRRAYLADFGLALQGQVTRLTRSGVLVGTAGYLAPEQVRGGDVLPAADVYALGLVLLECLTGRPEYPGGDTEAALSRLHREPRIPADLPEPLTAVLTAMTSSDPFRRPSAAECERLLDEAARASVGLPPLDEVAAVVERAEPTPARKPTKPVLLIGAAVAVGALTVLGLTVFGDGTASENGEEARQPGRTTTSTTADPVAEQAPSTGVLAPGVPSASTVTVVQGAPSPAGSGEDDGAGDGSDDGADEDAAATGTTTTKTTRPEPPPNNAPVVIVPAPVTPTFAGSPTTGPPTKERGGSGRG